MLMVLDEPNTSYKYEFDVRGGGVTSINSPSYY